MSQIAIANAFFRARESALPAPDRILDDPFAVALVRSQWRLRALWVLRRIVPGLARLFDELQTVHCVRHASVDALVRPRRAGGRWTAVPTSRTSATCCARITAASCT